MRSAVVSLVVCLCLQVAVAQVVTGPRTPYTRRTNARYAAPPTITLPRIDVSQAAEEDAAAGKAPLRYALPIETTITTENSGQWSETDGGRGRMWRLTVNSAGALNLGLIFSKFSMPSKAEFFVYTDKETLGAFTAANVKEHGKFSIKPVQGDTLTLEYYQPFASPLPDFTISKIGHGYRHVLGDYHDSGTCNVNVICDLADDWRDQLRGVAMIMTGEGFRLCSGSMINNVRDDGKQLFLTANHCCDGEDTDQWIMVFNYESPICAYDQEKDGPTDQTSQGTTKLANNAYSDFCLLELQETIPKEYNVWLNGFEAHEQVPETPFIIHHPSADVKKISNSLANVTSGDWGTYTGESHWRIPVYNNGTTEPGSSGSPMFDQNKRIVGQLHGGIASCDNNIDDWYGKVSKSWAHNTAANAHLQPFLDPDHKMIKKMDGRNLYQ